MGLATMHVAILVDNFSKMKEIVVADATAEEASEPEADGGEQSAPAPYKWVEFAQLECHETLAADALEEETQKSFQEEAGDMFNEATKSARSFIAKKRKGKDAAAAQAADLSQAAPQFDASYPLTAITTKLGGAVPTERDPAIAGHIVLLGPDMVEEGALPWHVLYCALKAGAAGVIWSSKPDYPLEALRSTVFVIPCVSISEDTGKQLEQLVAKETDADDMFAPIP